MRARIALSLLACTALAATMPIAAPALAQNAKKIVRTQDDLPRYSYPIEGSASGLLNADDATFAAFAAKVRADVDRTLADYDVQDHATLRDLLSRRLALQMLSGKEDKEALETVHQIRALEDKPDAKMMSGLRSEAVLNARLATGQSSGPAYADAYAKAYAAAIKPLPWAVVGNRIKEAKSSAQIISAALIQGSIKADVDPAVEKTHQLGDRLAAGLIAARASLKIVLPLKQETINLLSAEVAANSVRKPDIWAARDVTLTAADKLTPVTIAIWDSGSDLSLIPAQTYTDPKPAGGAPYGPHGLAFDLESRPATGVLLPLDAERAKQYPDMQRDLKGFSDLQQSIDSPEADALRAKIAGLSKDQVPAFLETLGFFGNYVHGTHVMGLAAHGNPAARVAVARITFDWHNVPLAPTEELVKRGQDAYKTYVDWFRSHGVRVVNMSWGGAPQDYEHALEANGIGKDAADRKAIARRYFDGDRAALLAALRSAPEILFVCAAGNSDADSGFDESIPASLALPNLLVVGAVDQAGDEASFTSYGKTVKVDANGYQVDSLTPGGKHLQLSGTSMASPNTANLAAKLIALDPKLTPVETIKLIVDGATTTPDGRRHNIDAKASVALLRQKTGTK
jgi:subtilisin family serine protease